MKIKHFLCIFGLVSVALCSCSDDDDDHVVVNDEAVKKTFTQMFPDTQVQEWEMEMGFYKAEFVKDGKSVEAWFKTDGTWMKTETDVLLSDLPAPAKEYLSTQYPTNHVDDVDWVETPQGNYFLVELDAQGADIYLKFQADGTLITT